MNIIYVLWCGDTPDKGVATTDLATFGKAREALRESKVEFRYALVPVTPASDVLAATQLLIKEHTQ